MRPAVSLRLLVLEPQNVREGVLAAVGGLAFASALVTNTAYSLEHDAAAALPPLSPRRPFRSAELLLRDRRWLTAFAAETAGWLMYVAALRLAPLALGQSPSATPRTGCGAGCRSSTGC